MFGFTMSDAWRKLVQCALNATAGAACVLFTPRANAELVSFEAAVQARVHKLRCWYERCTFNIRSGDNTAQS